MKFIDNIELVDLPLNYLKLTETQKLVAEKNNDKVITLFTTKPKEA